MTRFSLNEQNQYDVDIRLISLLLRYAGDEQYKFTAISFLKIARYAIENAIKPLLSAILDNMSIYRKDMNRIKTLYFGVFIYLYELINNTNYSSYIGKQEKELVISLLKTKSLDYGNSYSNMIEYFLGTYRFDDDALYSMQFFVKDYYSFSDDKHPEYSFFDREVLLNIFFSKMIFLDEKLAYLSIFKNDNDTYGYYANYCYTFFNDLLNKSISTNVTEPLSQMLEFYGNYSFLYFVTEDDEKLERIKKSMFDIVNELLKDRNERFSDSEKYESLLCDNLQKVTNAINEIFDAEFSGVKNCKPKGKVQKESIMLPILDFPLTYNGVEGIARNIYNYHILL